MRPFENTWDGVGIPPELQGEAEAAEDSIQSAKDKMEEFHFCPQCLCLSFRKCYLFLKVPESSIIYRFHHPPHGYPVFEFYPQLKIHWTH